MTDARDWRPPLKTASRRSLLAAAALGLGAVTPLSVAGRDRKPVGCKAREAYVGGPLHYVVPDEVFAQATAAGKSRLHLAIQDRIDDAFDRLAPHGGSALVAGAIAGADGALWNQVRGAPRGAEPTRFIWPGLRDLCLTTAVIQAAEEGKLSLEDRLTRWAPQTPGAGAIKVEDLMSHTSGLTGAAPAFCPGANWAASDADTALLASVLKAADGKSLGECLQARIADRLSLEETVFLSPAQDLPGLARPTGYVIADAEPAASAPDVLRIWRGLMAGRLHGETSVHSRYYRLYPVTAQPGAFSGQGVMAFDRPGDLWLGRSGGAAGGPSALVAYSRRKQAFAAFTTNSAQLPLEPMVETLFSAMLAPGEVDPALKKQTYTAPPRRRRKR